MTTQTQGRWVRRGGTIAVLPGGSARGASGWALEGEFEVPAKAPAGLKLLPHTHVPRDAAGAALARARMTPAAMNPGFIDPGTGALRLDASATGLQGRLAKLIGGAKYAKYKNRIALAVVDLTGAKRFAPHYAGWRSTVAIYGASLPKIAPLYGVRQLEMDLQALAEAERPATLDALIAAAERLWAANGVAKAAQPKLKELFTLTPGPSPVVAQTAKLAQLVKCTFDDNCNWAATMLIDRLGYPYLSSALWQSGLFHPTRGGLWLKGNYGEARTCCFPSDTIRASTPIHVPGAAASHNATALGAATYFTLMAQGRLGDGARSTRIRGDLVNACSLVYPALKGAGCSEIPSKCGMWKGFQHDVVLVDCPGKPVRYVLALLTVDALATAADKTALLTDLPREVENLVKLNNP